MATTATFVRTAAPRRLYVGLALLAIAMAAVGFWPTYFGQLLAGTVDKVGRLAIGYGVLVIVAGLVAAFGMFALRVRAGSVAEAQGGLLGPLVDMAVFTPLFVAAIYNRRKPDLHKRLMIVATTYLLIAAVGRMPFLGEPRNLLLVHLVWVTPLLLAMAHDLVRHRRVHPIYVFGLILFLASGSAVRAVVRSSEAWLQITGRLVPWVS